MMHLALVQPVTRRLRATLTGLVCGAQMVCVHAAVGVEAPLGSCLLLRQEKSWRSTEEDFGHLMEGPKALVWCVDNAGATFVVCSPEQGSPPGARTLHA